MPSIVGIMLLVVLGGVLARYVTSGADAPGPGAAVEAYHEALQANDCAGVSAVATSKFADCGLVASQSELIKGWDFTIGEVRMVDDSRAAVEVVRVTGDDAPERTDWMSVVKQDGAWLVDGFTDPDGTPE